MASDNKFLIGIGAITIAIIIAGVFFLGKGTNKDKGQLESVDTLTLSQNAQHAKGKYDSAVKIVEFADLQCPACKQAQPIVEKLLEDNQDKIYFVFRHYPLSVHKNAKLAAQAAESAGNQNKFFEMVHIQYLKQADWQNKSNPREEFRKYAQELGLDLERFNKDMEEIKKPIEDDFALGNRVGVDSTPTFFINGQKYSGVMQPSELQQLIDSLTQVDQQQSTPEASQ